MSGGDDGVLAIDAGTGKKRWNFDEMGGPASTPVVSGGMVYVNNLDGKLYALRAKDGKKRWTTEYYRGDRRQYWNYIPAVSNGLVYVSSEDGHLYAFDAKSEKIAGRSTWTAE